MFRNKLAALDFYAPENFEYLDEKVSPTISQKKYNNYKNVSFTRCSAIL